MVNHIVRFRGSLEGVLCGLILSLCIGSCGTSGKEPSSSITSILTAKEVQVVIASSGDSLIALDLWAEWCGPCRALAPTLERIAAENKTAVSFYRINVDQVPEAEQAFRVAGIPFVAFLKGGKVVATVTGLHPAEDYEKIIRRFSGMGNTMPPPGGDGM